LAGRATEATFERFLELWQRLLADQEVAVLVVEGERDVRSLRRLGWTGPIEAVHRGKPLAETAERLLRLRRRVVVLTDWDSEGGEIARKLRGFLGTTEFDLDLRRNLARLLRGELVHVEGLYGWARRTAERLGRPLELLLDGEEPAVSPVRG
jgi:5S rRNA maturation endonuclease (ribonuclease M5)